MLDLLLQPFYYYLFLWAVDDRFDGQLDNLAGMEMAGERQLKVRLVPVPGHRVVLVHHGAINVSA